MVDIVAVKSVEFLLKNPNQEWADYVVGKDAEGDLYVGRDSESSSRLYFDVDMARAVIAALSTVINDG